MVCQQLAPRPDNEDLSSCEDFLFGCYLKSVLLEATTITFKKRGNLSERVTRGLRGVNEMFIFTSSKPARDRLYQSSSDFTFAEIQIETFVYQGLERIFRPRQIVLLDLCVRCDCAGSDGRFITPKVGGSIPPPATKNPYPNQ
jgi:hypothetical protein